MAFRLKTSKLLANRRKAYFLDVICKKFHFGEVQEEVLGQRSGNNISARRKKGLSICLSAVCFLKKSSRMVEEMSLQTLHWGFYVCLGNYGKIEVHRKSDSLKVGNTACKYQRKKREPVNYVAFLLITLANSTAFPI